MKKSFKENTKWGVLLLIIFSQIFFLLSCRNNENISPTNAVSLKYNGKVITFDDVKIREDYLDLDAGIGLRVFGTNDIVDENGYTYYVIIDFRKDAANKYSFHKINFGTKKNAGKDLFQLKLYYANLTEGFNETKFQTEIFSDASEIKGTFSGRLLSLFDPEISISDGKYALFLSTVK